MELLMKNIHMCRQGKRAGLPVTLEEDFNVPDVKPDVEQMIQSKERIVVEQTRSENRRVIASGFLEVSILYLGDTKERQLYRMDTKLPFDESIIIEGLKSGEAVRLSCTAEDVNVALINSRKLSVRAVIVFEASAEEIYDISAAADVRSDFQIMKQSRKLEMMQIEVQKKDILRLKEETVIQAGKPNIKEILWENIQLRSCRVVQRKEKLAVQGKIFLFVLYRGEDETGSEQWSEQVLPFEGELECSGCSVEMIPDIEVSLAQTELQPREDTDGERRLLHLEGVLELEIRLYQNEEAEILEDVYSPQKKLIPVVEEELYESLLMKNASRCKTSGKIRIQGTKPRILQICHVTGSVKIDKTQIVQDGIQIEGAVPVSILYISAEDSMPFAVLDGVLPFTHFAEVPGIDDKCRFTLRTALDQLSASMADSEEIEVKFTVNLDLLVIRPQKQKCICEISEEAYDPEELADVPGITGYIVQEGDTLWKIARSYFLTPAQIVRMNQLESEEIKKGDRLILMKNISGCSLTEEEKQSKIK